MSRKFRLAAAAVSAVALTSMTFGSTVMAAPGDSNTADVATIDASRATSLSIHKYEGPANTSVECTPNGQPAEACVEGKTPLPGAEFTVYKVMDLDTIAQWQEAQKLYEAGAGTYNPTTEGTALTTGEDGLAKFENLDVALYYVKETKTPEGYTGAAPFFITLPMTVPGDNAWDYDLDVYPKNDKVDAPHKAVVDVDTIQPGDTIEYRVTSKVPNHGDVVGAPKDGKFTAPDGKYDHNDLNYFVIGDTFPAELTNPAVSKVMLGSIELVRDVDYTVTGTAPTVQVEFTADGLDKITAQYSATATDPIIGDVTVHYTATVVDTFGGGTIENEAWNVPAPKPTEGSAPNIWDGEPGEPGNTVTSQFLPVTINKLASDVEGKTLEVTFQIVQAGDKNNDGTVSCSAADIAGNPVLDEFVTTDGVGTSVPLRVSTWYNDGLEADSAGRNDGHLDGAQYAEKHGYLNYCLVETVAADGYQLLAEPIQFTIQDTIRDAAAVPFGHEIFSLDQDAAAEGIQVFNQPDNLNNNLPLTGGQGTALLSLAGLALVAGGAGYYFVSNRRREEAQN